MENRSWRVEATLLAAVKENDWLQAPCHVVTKAKRYLRRLHVICKEWFHVRQQSHTGSETGGSRVLLSSKVTAYTTACAHTHIRQR